MTTIASGPVGIDRDTLLCMSLSARPSNFGTRFHNHLYAQLGLNYVYKAFTTDDLAAAVAGIRALGIRGCGVSMPYKTEVMAQLDEIDPAATAIGAVNTIVNTDHVLAGYNTDYQAVRDLLAQHQVPNDVEVVLLGAGGMAKAVGQALRSHGFDRGTVVARNPETGKSLAASIGFGWQPATTELAPAVLINATPVGMAGGPAANDLPAPAELLDLGSDRAGRGGGAGRNAIGRPLARGRDRRDRRRRGGRTPGDRAVRVVYRDPSDPGTGGAGSRFRAAVTPQQTPGRLAA